VSKKTKNNDARRMNDMLAKVVGTCLAEPALPEVGIHHARLFSLGYPEDEVIRLVGMILVAHLYGAKNTLGSIDRSRLRFEWAKLPQIDVGGSGQFVDVHDLFENKS
jgi:hypothetical protein